MFTMIKLISRHQNTQHFGAMLPVDLTNEGIKNSTTYKEYYAIASEAAPPKIKASVRKTQSSSDTTMPPLTVALTEAEKIKLATKRSLQHNHIFQASGSDDNDDDQDSDNDDDDFVHPKLSAHDEEAKDEESFDPIVQTLSHVENSNDESNDDKSHGMNVRGDEGPNAEDDHEDLYRDVNINLEGIDSLFKLTHRVDVPVTTTVVPLLVTVPTLPPPFIPIISQVQQAPAPSLAITPSTSLQDLLNFGSLFGFDHRLKILEANFSEFLQTNQFAKSVSYILGIVDRYIDHRMNEAVKVAVQLQSDRLRDEAQAKNEDFLNKLDENIQKIIKEQVKVQVSKILPKIEKTVNEQLEAEVLTRASNSSKTSYVVTVDLSELDLKKIIIKKMESNKRASKEPELTSALKEKASKTFGKSTEGSKSHQKTASESAPAEEPMQTTQYLEEPLHQEFKTGVGDDVAEASQHPKWFQKQTKPLTPNRAWNKTLPATHESIQPWISDLAKQADSRTSFNELPMDFSAFLMNRLKVDTLTPELLAGQQYPHNLLKPLPLIPNSQGRHAIPFDHFISNDLEYQRGGASSRKYTTSVTKTKAADYGHIKESTQDVYSKRRIIVVTELQIIKWHNYKHLDWITMRRDDDKLYKFKEGNLKRLRIQDIEDMLLLLVQGKLTNHCRKTLCFQHLFKDVHEKHRHPTTCGRSSIRKIHTLARNHIKEILLKLNLPDHRSILTNSQRKVLWPGHEGYLQVSMAWARGNHKDFGMIRERLRPSAWCLSD
nr:hypothetical protein [Tanacetum cinerariifolium]